MVSSRLLSVQPLCRPTRVPSLPRTGLQSPPPDSHPDQTLHLRPTAARLYSHPDQPPAVFVLQSRHLGVQDIALTSALPTPLLTQRPCRSLSHDSRSASPYSIAHCSALRRIKPARESGSLGPAPPSGQAWSSAACMDSGVGSTRTRG